MIDSEIQRCLSEGESAFEQLVRKYSAIVLNTALCRLNNRQLAEEVTQSVFIILHQKLPQLSRDVSVLGWLIRATRFVADRTAKAEARRHANEAHAMEQLEITREPDSAEMIFPLVGEAIVHLKVKEQRCVVARFFEDASFKQIADTERISEDAAQKRVMRALEKMRAFLIRRGLKIAGAAAVPALLTRSTSAADATLVVGIMQSVAATKVTAGAGGISLVLAKKAAALIQWKSRIAFIAKLACITLLLVAPATLLVIERKPPIPVAATMPAASATTTDLARQWAAVVRDVAALITHPPAPNDLAAVARFNAAYTKTVNDSDRIVSALRTSLDPQTDRIQVAQFLTLELHDNLTLKVDQQAFAFRYVSNLINSAPTLKDALNDLYNNRAAHAQAIRAILSIHQRWNFDRTYRRDGLGLFAITPTLASAL